MKTDTHPCLLKAAMTTLILLPLVGSHVACFAQSGPGNLQQIPAQQNPGLLTPKIPAGLPAQPSPMSQNNLDEINLDVPQQQHAQYTNAPKLQVNQIRIEGVTLLKAADIQAIAAPYLGKENTFDQLNQLTDAITNLYRKQGYLTAEAYIPPQNVAGGVLTIQVQEGYVGKIAVEGNRFYRACLIKHAVHLKSGHLLNFRVLESDLNRINRLNDGYKVKAFLAAGDHPGETNIKLKVAERQPLQISGTFDNQGRPFIGMYRSGIELRDDSLTTLGDKLYGRWISSPQTQVAMGSYTLPLNRFGTELNTSFSFSKVNLMLPVKNPPTIIGKSYSSSIGLFQPLDRDRHWIADVGVNYMRVGSYFDGDKTSDTDIRALQTGLTYDRPDRWGRTYNRIQSTFAMGGLGSSVRSSRFWKVENYFNRLIVLPKNNLLILKAYAQMTPDALPAAEQFQIGGDSSVRGYTEGVLIGDRGLNLGIEDRFPIPGLRLISPWLSQRLQAAVFYDYGRVWLDHSNPTYAKSISDVKQRTLLQSVGFGFRAQLTRLLQGYVDFGFGLGDRSAVEPLHRQPTARIHFGIRTDLMPMAYRMRGNPISINSTPYIAARGK